MPDLKNRRPLNSRNTKWADRISRALAARNISPNQISIASMVVAFGAGAAFWLTHLVSDSRQTAALLLIAALCCQLRLLCNLFDGMVAVEGGKSAADGPFWNEFPDRISDIFIFAGAGLAVGSPAIGWAAASLAVLAAYTRELGANIGLPPDFSGPMAKQHRMALMTLAAIIATTEPLWIEQGTVLTIALWLIIAGGIVTVIRRARNIRKSLIEKANASDA
ncbi:CDP-diacylglycerol--glycerol-3-phosphate 3-phosphatidyltransferase [Thalassospira profundimaris]|uniref:CDP-diacylglycerol--glycerol-3-phosphate 3-phosphatidyltransferase n=1 Tax=Thalassospira profundimaris TaxID=502049 RepID=A0A367X9L9_9PROT|nr:CDP-alcohol phosphatidyltransferase family protein [Thalassospira profundimaris]RCK50344.1 CDP-diacylglycerol--glycerol-3-phosphate 3-phosphatidyltransferase [Thalassospira profundimaris]